MNRLSRASRIPLLLAAVASLAGCSESPPGRGRGTVSSGVARAAEPVPADAAPAATPSPATRSPVAGPRVIVVGAGISGLATALELGRGGADVTVLDMSSVFGGHAVMSQGAVSIVGTPAQAEAGIKDSAELARRDFQEFGDDPDEEWVRYYVDHSREEIYDWLIDLGIRFEEVVRSPGNTVPREHQPAGRGIGLVTPIYRECLEHPNVRFVWNTKAEQLLQEEGRVTGVAGRNLRTGQEERFAAEAVVLATGGFQSNLDMVREFWPAEFRFPERILAGSGRNSIGLGHRLAESAGGELVHMDRQWNYFTGIPDPRDAESKRGLSAANLYGIIVNSEGKRFANLHGWAKEVMPALFRQKRATLWFIFDEATRPKFVVSGTDWADFNKVEREILRNESLVKSAATLEELAEKAGLPKENLVATVQRWNELVERGDDEDFQRFGPGRPEFAENASPKIGTPPFYAMQAYPLTRKSMGGVAIDRTCRVLDREKRPIPGLFAVGELTGLALINGKAALEGTFLGPCIVTGRVAARSILVESQSSSVAIPADPKTAAAGTTRCTDCHDVKQILEKPREGFWHFEQVHRVALERTADCRHCHAELAPYDESRHRIHPLALSATCVQCHVAQE